MNFVLNQLRSIVWRLSNGQFRYRKEDLNPEDKNTFKISFVYPIVDIALSKLHERFEHLSQLQNIFGFLFDLHSSNISLNECERLGKTLTSTKDKSKDLNAAHLLDEIKSFQALVDNNGEKAPLEFLNKIHMMGLEPIYPNLTTALKIFLTLPVTTAAAESSFSKLKIIKNYLRTTMKQERLNNLATLSIDTEILESIPQKNIIEKFAKAKARQAIFN